MKDFQDLEQKYSLSKFIWQEIEGQLCQIYLKPIKGKKTERLKCSKFSPLACLDKKVTQEKFGLVIVDLGKNKRCLLFGASSQNHFISETSKGKIKDLDIIMKYERKYMAIV